MNKFQQIIGHFILFFGIVFLPGYALAQGGPDFDKVQIKTIKVTDGIYMLVGQGGNIGVSIGEDGAFLIDDQFAPLTNKIKKAVADLTDKPIKFLFNTHWHGDHTGGNENFGKEGVLIVAHDNVRTRMSKENKLFNRTVPPSPKVALPVITYNNGINFHLNGNEVKLIHPSNAHTDGDTVIYFKEANVIHGGDTIFSGAYPFIDVGSGGSIGGLIKAVEATLALADDDTKIIPGHGPLTDKKGLTTYHNTLVTVRDRVKKLKDEGKTLDEVKALKPNADLDGDWGKGFISAEAIIQTVYMSLK